MRSFIVVLVLALVGCNGSSTSAPAVDPALAQIQALQNQVNTLQGKLDKIQLIGRVNGQTAQTRDISSPREFAMLSEPTLAPAASTAPSISGQFGPCADMGVLQGRGGSDTGNALDSQFEMFKQCTGYTYAISNLTGMMDVPPYLTWDGPNCTGNAYLEMDVPQNTMNADAVKNGVVFHSPLPGDSTVFQVNSTKNPPQNIMIQSAINTRGGVCGPDQEVRLVVIAIPNDVSITGVPNSLVPNTWSTVAP